MTAGIFDIRYDAFAHFEEILDLVECSAGRLGYMVFVFHNVSHFPFITIIFTYQAGNVSSTRLMDDVFEFMSLDGEVVVVIYVNVL